MHGVNVDPANPYGRPDGHSLVARGFQTVRLVPRMQTQVLAWANMAALQGLKFAYVFDHQALGWDRSKWPERAEEIIASFPRAELYVLFNEPDAGIASGKSKEQRQQDNPSSWIMDLDEWVANHQYLVPTFIQAGCTVGTAASVGGRPDLLTWPYSAMSYHVACVHPYSKNAVEATNLLQQYRNIIWPEARLAVTEWWRPKREVQDFAQMLDGAGIDAWWFCWSHGMVSGMGVVDTDGNLTGEGKKLVAYLGGTGEDPHPMAEFVLGFKQFHDWNPEIVGEPKRRPEFNTGFPGWQVQTTTNGILSWHQGEGMIFVSNDERVWTWPAGENAPEEL